LRGHSSVVGAIAVWSPEESDPTVLVTLAELVSSGARTADQVGRLRQRTRRGDEMLRHAAHEVRRPLSVLHADLELLEDDLPAPGPERDKVMARLRSAVDDMRDIADDVLGYERLVAGVAPALPFELGEAVRKACAPHEERVICSGEEGVIVHGDPTLIVSAIRNLVDNAVKYSPAERPVVVAWAAAGDYTAIEVQDEGPGIAPNDQTRIFEPFRRLPRSKGPGIGLGLSLVRAVAEAHGGSVRVESVPGRGATFTLVLRAAPQTAPETPAGGNGAGSLPRSAESPRSEREDSATADRRYVGATRPN
jgi:two-component system sensor histidine kinase KdpD